jgi:DNA polymerase I-like protein with 3'-5' exonuclease and polymerase domains
MLRIRARLNENERILLQVHDSLVLEGPDWRRLVRIMVEEMQRPIEICGMSVSFLVEVQYGTNWGHLEKIDFKEVINGIDA